MSEFERMRDELEAWSQPDGMSASVLLQLNEPLRSVLRRILRSGSVTFSELALELGLEMPETEQIADLLVRCGFLKTSEVEAGGEVVYRIRHSKQHRPEAPVALWDRLLGESPPPEEES